MKIRLLHAAKKYFLSRIFLKKQAIKAEDIDMK